MAVQNLSGRILSTSSIVSLVAFLALCFGVAEPARAAHFLTHPADAPIVTSAGPSVATLAAQATAQAGTRSAAQNAAKANNRAVNLFQQGAVIKINKDASVFITARNIPENDRLLEGYNAGLANAGAAAMAPGLLGIANQAHRAQDPDGRNAQAYSLADAMRDAIWRKNTAARLKSMTETQSACADGSAARTPSIGLVATCY